MRLSSSLMRQERFSLSLLCGMIAMAQILGESFAYHVSVCVLTLYVADWMSGRYVFVRSIGIVFVWIISVVDTFVEISEIVYLPLFLAIQCVCTIWAFLQCPEIVRELPTRAVQSVESFLLTWVPTLVSVTVSIATNNIFSEHPIASAFMFFLMTGMQHMFLYEASVMSVTSPKVEVHLSLTTRKAHQVLFHVGPAIVYLFNCNEYYNHYGLILCLVGPVACALERKGKKNMRVLRFCVCAATVWAILLLHGGTSWQSSMLSSFCVAFANSEWLRHHEIQTIVPIVTTRQYGYSDALAVVSCACSALLVGIPLSVVLLIIVPFVLYVRTQKHAILLIAPMFIFFIWEPVYVMNLTSKMGVQHATFHRFVQIISRDDFLICFHVVISFLVSRHLKENFTLRNIWSFSSFLVLLVLSTRYLLTSAAILVSSLCLISFRLRHDEDDSCLTAPSFFCACFLCILTLCDIIMMTTTSLVLGGSSWFFATVAHVLTWISVLDPTHRYAISHTTVLPLHVLGLILARTYSSVSYSALGVAWVSFQGVISYNRWREGQMFL